MTNVKINSKSKIEELEWKNIEAGEVFEFISDTDSDVYIGMKVIHFENEYILDLSDDRFWLYSDIESYKFLRILDCNIEVG